MFANVVSLFAQPTVQALTAGVLAGAIGGGALLATGAIPLEPADTTQTVALLACPGSGPTLGRISAGQALLVTGRSPDGAWLEVYIDQPSVDRAWAPASALKLEASVDSLPVAVCGVPPSVLPTLAPPTLLPSAAPSPNPSIEPSALPSIVATVVPGTSPSPTPIATKTPAPSKTPTVSIAPTLTPLPPPPTFPPSPSPSPTPSPSPVPDITAPSITGVTITGAWHDGSGNYYIDNAGNGCATPTSATITISVTDPGGSGVNGLTVYLRFIPQGSGQYNIPMARNLVTGLWSATINNNAGWLPGYIDYWVTASDNAGNPATTSHPPDSSHWLFKGDCIL